MANTTYRPGGIMSTRAFTITVSDLMSSSAVDIQLTTIAEALDALAEQVDGYHEQQGILQAAADVYDVLAGRSRK